MQLVIRTMTVKAKPIYQCSGCGCTAEGDTVTIELPDLRADASEISAIITAKSKTVSNSYMPVGWAGYGLQVVRCPSCIK